MEVGCFKQNPVFMTLISEIDPKTGLVIRFSSKSITSHLASEPSSPPLEPLDDKRKRKKSDRSGTDKEELEKQKKEKKSKLSPKHK